MTHDPLCPYRTPVTDPDSYHGEHIVVLAPSVPCQCELIGKVREDERYKIADAVAENMLAYPYEYPADYAEADRTWIRRGCPQWP